MTNEWPRHTCGICGGKTTAHGSACTKDKKRILEQAHRYLPVAELLTIEVNAKFGTYADQLKTGERHDRI